MPARPRIGPEEPPRRVFGPVRPPQAAEDENEDLSDEDMRESRSGLSSDSEDHSGSSLDDQDGMRSHRRGRHVERGSPRGARRHRFERDGLRGVRRDRRVDLRENQLLEELRADGVSQSAVNSTLASIPQLRDKDFDVWMAAVADALFGAGMYSLFAVTLVQQDSLAQESDLRKCDRFRPWMMGSAWTAIRRSIGVETAAYASTIDVPMGDVKALLRALRKHFDKNSVPEQHRLLAQLRRVAQADFRDIKSYVGALETIFAKLAKIGKVLDDSDKKYYLLEGLSVDFRRGVSGNIYTYENPHGEPADYAKSVRILSLWEDGCAVGTRKHHRDLAMPMVANARCQAKGKKTVPCIMYTRKGYCRYSSKCRFQHIGAPVRPKSSSASAPDKAHQPLNKRHGNKDHVKKLGFGGRCHKCGKTGHKRKDCTGDHASVAVDLVASVHDNVSNLHGSREDAREGDRGWLQHDFDGEAEDEDVAQDVRHVDFAFPVLPKSGHSLCAWMVDGGSPCPVLGAVDFYSKFIFNRRPASISITVG